MKTEVKSFDKLLSLILLRPNEEKLHWRHRQSEGAQCPLRCFPQANLDMAVRMIHGDHPSLPAEGQWGYRGGKGALKLAEGDAHLTCETFGDLHAWLEHC